MDGYALREADIKGACQEQPVILKVIYKTCAGDPPGRRLLPGECVRIMTGAVLPEGADCVIRQEDTDEGESRVRIYSGGRHSKTAVRPVKISSREIFWQEPEIAWMPI